MREADLLPSILLNFRWGEEVRAGMARQPTLKQELLAEAAPANPDEF